MQSRLLPGCVGLVARMKYCSARPFFPSTAGSKRPRNLLRAEFAAQVTKCACLPNRRDTAIYLSRDPVRASSSSLARSAGRRLLQQHLVRTLCFACTRPLSRAKPDHARDAALAGSLVEAVVCVTPLFAISGPSRSVPALRSGGKLTKTSFKDVPSEPRTKESFLWGLVSTGRGLLGSDACWNIT